MKTILIADTSKPSLVMISEAFKEKILGARIVIVDSGKECIQTAKKIEPDMVVIDSDLPDADAPSITETLRKRYTGPILIVGFKNRMLQKIIDEDLFFYNDCSQLIEKPIQMEDLFQKIDAFLLEKGRINKRFDMDAESIITKKSVGRGRKARKVKGKSINLSIRGASLELEKDEKLKKNDLVNLSFFMEKKKKVTKANAKKKAKVTKSKTKKKTTAKKVPTKEYKFTGKVAWKKGDQVGVTFEKLPEKSFSDLSTLLYDLHKNS